MDPGKYLKLTSKGGLALISPQSSKFSPIIFGLVLGSTAVVFKASLRQSIWTIWTRTQCLAPHQLLVNAHYCLKCYLQTIYILVSASSSSSGITCQGRVSSTSKTLYSLMVKLSPNPPVELSKRYSPHPHFGSTWATTQTCNSETLWVLRSILPSIKSMMSRTSLIH